MSHRYRSHSGTRVLRLYISAWRSPVSGVTWVRFLAREDESAAAGAGPVAHRRPDPLGRPA
jgi:hypothetical protein